MVIASIDLKDGKVVQLKQGRDLVLERDDPAALAVEFDRYGEVAVIDLDAALGSGSNDVLVKSLLRRAACRVGGGIRSVQRAKELISLGATKVIIGSVAFRSGGAFGVNQDFLSALSAAIGRERIIVAVDSRGERVTVDGWKTDTGLDLYESARAVEQFAGELLFTCVEREGTLTGIDLDQARKLRQSVSCGICAAGGVSSLEEIEALARLGCDVQLGMALYTGKIALADAFIRSLSWGQAKLPLAAQTADGQVLRIGWADRASLAASFSSGLLSFAAPPTPEAAEAAEAPASAESSGAGPAEPSVGVLKLLRLRADCRRAALLATAETAGPACRTGAWSCFGERRYTLERLRDIIADRFRSPTPGSYTATLDDERVREKLMEEAQEVVEAGTHDEIVWELADLFYFATVLMTRAGVSLAEVLAELDRRHKK